MEGAVCLGSECSTHPCIPNDVDDKCPDGLECFQNIINSNDGICVAKSAIINTTTSDDDRRVCQENADCPKGQACFGLVDYSMGSGQVVVQGRCLPEYGPCDTQCDCKNAKTICAGISSQVPFSAQYWGLFLFNKKWNPRERERERERKKLCLELFEQKIDFKKVPSKMVVECLCNNQTLKENNAFYFTEILLLYLQGQPSLRSEVHDWPGMPRTLRVLCLWHVYKVTLSQGWSFSLFYLLKTYFVSPFLSKKNQECMTIFDNQVQCRRYRKAAYENDPVCETDCDCSQVEGCSGLFCNKCTGRCQGETWLKMIDFIFMKLLACHTCGRVHSLQKWFTSSKLIANASYTCVAKVFFFKNKGVRFVSVQKFS